MNRPNPDFGVPIPEQTLPIYNPNAPLPKPDLPRPERPQQSADHGDADFVFSITNGDALYQVFGSPLTTERTLELRTEGAQNGSSVGSLDGDAVYVVRSSPVPSPIYPFPTTFEALTVDTFGVVRSETRIDEGQPEMPAEEPPLTVTTPHPRFPFGAPLATLENRQWAKFVFIRDQWQLMARGVLEQK